ncbi:MAG: DUF421 domain-containing protein [Chitinophagaceae bacterium]|nr:MAG: DUF421 domain-containing protein [Chitinophagaceae bacterium]
MDLTGVWGVKDDITIPEISLRAAVMFLAMILMLRLSGMRSFGKGDVFDNILTILLGAVLARGIVGATPFLSALAGGVVIMLIHNLLSNLSFYHRWIGRAVKGKAMILYQNGDFLWENMNKANISKNDIEEQLRVKLNTNSLEEVDEIYFERTGKVSFTKKPKQNS